MADHTTQDGAFPREDLYRAVYPGVEVRDQTENGMPTLVGQFAVFDEWTEINSAFEGQFMERNKPGAFTKTLNENRAKIRVLFQHGKDPQIGDKPLGPLENVSPDGRYEVPMLDTAYNRELVPGLKAGLYGSSYRFQVMKEEIVQNPKRSDHNPKGLPERTITEAKVLEFGPVTFPAYEGATAGVRSLSDRFHEPDEIKVHSTLHIEGEKIAEAVRTINEGRKDPVALEPTETSQPADEPQALTRKVSRTGAPIDLYPKREETQPWRL